MEGVLEGGARGGTAEIEELVSDEMQALVRIYYIEGDLNDKKARQASTDDQVGKRA